MNPTSPASAQPFESAAELRERHAQLVEALDVALAAGPDVPGSPRVPGTSGAPGVPDGVDVSDAQATRRIEPDIHAFLERAAATGAYLEDVKERTACQALVDYWVSSLAQAGVQAPSARLAAFDGSRLPDLKDKPCPYMGLEAFRRDDQDYFFGREADVGSVLAQLQTAPLLVVLGASGSGKSSLVMGGVLPALATAGASTALRIAPVFVPGADVLPRLAGAVLQGAGLEAAVDEVVTDLRREPASLATLLAARPPLLVTIDQFEEVFTLCPAADREAAAAALSALLAGASGHRVILTMREEFRSRLVELQPLVPFLDRAWYSMRPMGYAELRAAIERPAARVNLQFQPGIVDDLVKKVLGQPAALPLLQFTLRELWNARDRNRITREVYRKVGDPLVALQASADVFFDGLAPQTQAEARRILLELVRVDELLEAYRQPVPKSRLLRAGKANTDEVLVLLVNQDWVRCTEGTVGPEGPGDDTIVEVKHEALIRNWPRLVGWIDEKRVERRQRLAITQAAQRWAAAGRPSEGLLTGWQLEDAKRQADLAELENEFVEASAAEIERAQRERESTLRHEAERAHRLAHRERRLRRLAVLASVLVGALFLGSLYAWNLARIDFAKAAKGEEDQRKRAGTLANEAALLKGDRERLEGRHARLQAEYDKLFATRVQQSRLLASRQTRIHIQIAEESQRARAQEIQKQLVSSGVRIEQGIERVASGRRDTEVLYFHASDRAGAEELQRLLGQYVGVSDVRSRRVQGFENRAKPQSFEVWFGSEAFAPAASAANSCFEMRADAPAPSAASDSAEPRTYRLDAADLAAVTPDIAPGLTAGAAALPDLDPLLDPLREVLLPLQGVDYPTEAQFRAALRRSQCGYLERLANSRQAGEAGAAPGRPPSASSDRISGWLLRPELRDHIVRQATKVHRPGRAVALAWRSDPGCACGSALPDNDVYAFATYWSDGAPHGAGAAATPATGASPSATGRAIDCCIFSRVSFFGAVLDDAGELEMPEAVAHQGATLAREARRRNAALDLVVYRRDWHHLLQRPGQDLAGWAIKAVDSMVAALDAPLPLPAEPSQALLLPFWRDESRAYDGLTLFFDNVPAEGSEGVGAFADLHTLLIDTLARRLQASGRSVRLNIVVPEQRLGSRGPYAFKNLAELIGAVNRPGPGVSAGADEGGGAVGKSGLSLRYIVLLSGERQVAAKALRALVDDSPDLLGQGRTAFLASLLPMVIPPATNKAPWALREGAQAVRDELTYAKWSFGGVAVWDAPSVASASPASLELRRQLWSTFGPLGPSIAEDLCELVCPHRVPARLLLQALLLAGVLLVGFTLRRWFLPPPTPTRARGRLRRSLPFLWALATLTLASALLGCDPALAFLRESALGRSVPLAVAALFAASGLYGRFRKH